MMLNFNRKFYNVKVNHDIHLLRKIGWLKIHVDLSYNPTKKSGVECLTQCISPVVCLI